MYQFCHSYLVEIRETEDFIIANSLLNKKWLLLDHFINTDEDGVSSCTYILGRPSNIPKEEA